MFDVRVSITRKFALIFKALGEKRTIGKLDRVSGAVSLILGFYHHLDLFSSLSRSGIPLSLSLSSLSPLPSSAKFLFFFLLFRSVFEEEPSGKRDRTGPNHKFRRVM